MWSADNFLFFVRHILLSNNFVFYGGRLSDILDKPSVWVFPIWYTTYITWYTRYIISNVTFTIWKTWYNDCKCVVPGISHEKLGLRKNLSACSSFPCYVTGIRHTRVSHSHSLKFFCFGSVSIFKKRSVCLSLSRSCISFFRVKTI